MGEGVVYKKTSIALDYVHNKKCFNRINKNGCVPNISQHLPCKKLVIKMSKYTRQTLLFFQDSEGRPRDLL